jgi:phosphohistidine swiveling domain-containing protein
MKHTKMTSKARNLARMAEHGLRVPTWFYISENEAMPPHAKTWIVRSSFGVEDGLQSAFAGCFSSEVVPAGGDLSTAIERVRACILDEKVRERILAFGQNPARCEVAVIVQEFIAGCISGVAFSKNPQDGGPGFTEWAKGGCEPLTSGESPGSKARFSEASPPELKTFWRELRRGMHKLERLFSTPVDVEWTFDGERLWWLQVRPMTGEFALRFKKSQGKAEWTRDKIAERFPSIMTPMGWSMVEETLQHSMKSLVHYTGLKCRNVERASLFEKGYAFANARYFRYPNVVFTASALIKIVARSLRAIFTRTSVAHHVFLSPCSKQVLQQWNDELDEHLSAIRQFDPVVSVISMAAAKINELRALSFAFFKTDLAIHFLKEANVQMLTRALKVPSQSIAQFGNNETLMIHVSLRKLCNSLKDDDGMQRFVTDLRDKKDTAHEALNQGSQAAFAAFLEHCGHMSEGWDVTSRALRENPVAVAALIHMAMKAPEKESTNPVASISKIANKHLEMYENARALCAADEQQHFYAGLYLEKSRQVLASIAGLLIAVGLLKNTEDLFYLTAQELEKYLENPDYTLVTFVERRKKIWSRYEQREPAAACTSAEKLVGVGVSNGVAAGECYFADSFDELARMPANAVLCLKTPNPSFVPWFDLCSAIVTENGGALSHGFIAARELHIPAVSGIRLDDLRALGHVVVDGSGGTIRSNRLASSSVSNMV